MARAFMYQVVDQRWNGRLVALQLGDAVIVDLGGGGATSVWRRPDVVSGSCLTEGAELTTLGNTGEAVGFFGTSAGRAVVESLSDDGQSTFSVTVEVAPRRNLPRAPRPAVEPPS